jgi:hypothetical protein
VRILSQIDPTDSALAAIASILEQPSAHREPPAPEAVIVEEKPLAEEKMLVEEKALAEEQPLAPAAPIEPDGYSKVGPGPMAAIRFRWTARRDEDGHYYVDETIGENAAPIRLGPMSPDAAIRMVDDRESDARLRFEQLKSEMSGRGTAPDLALRDDDEL